ncbi:MAG: MOSC domain-containing protein, partial [Coleofasciculaceae cyanobacterium]
MTELKLTGIYIYPIKSAAGIALETAQVASQGFQYDRRWMVVQKGKFMTQRHFPRMALIRVRLSNEQLIIEAPAQKPLLIPLVLNSPNRISVQVWSDICDAIPLGEEVAEWFS